MNCDRMPAVALRLPRCRNTKPVDPLAANAIVRSLKGTSVIGPFPRTADRKRRNSQNITVVQSSNTAAVTLDHFDANGDLLILFDQCVVEVSYLCYRIHSHTLRREADS